MKRYFPVLIAVLGIIVGALSVATYNTWLQKKNFYKTQYGEWRKLNLILEQVDKNYVDTVDNEKVTDAAIVAALAELDPHSVYMPPVELDAAESLVASVLRKESLEDENSPIVVVAVLYALAYLNEHREEADHHALTITLRNLLFGERDARF